VQSKEIRQKRTGEPYLSLNLSDRTGDIEARMWDNVAEIMDTFERDSFIKVRGQLQIYNTRPQFIIHKTAAAGRFGSRLRGFFSGVFARSRRNVARVARDCSGVPNPHIRALLDAFLDDPEIAGRYRIAPALSLFIMLSAPGCSNMCFRFAESRCPGEALPQRGLESDGGGNRSARHRKDPRTDVRARFRLFDRGQLLGHIAIGMRMLSDKLREFPDFPRIGGRSSSI